MAEEEDELVKPKPSLPYFKDAPCSGTSLATLAEGFEDLARKLESGDDDLRLDAFSYACSLVSVLFGCLGIAFKFAEIEYVSKVDELYEASKTYDTLKNVLDYDVEQDTVKKPGSHSRHLRRVRLGLDLIKALFKQFLLSNDNSLREAASTAYAQTCAPFHPWAVRKAVGAGMYALPTREQLMLNLNETDDSIQKEMTRYIIASSSIIDYIDNLYTSRNISLDW
ncbi:ACD11 homolog protein [Dioscorea cayenensis subsp. rotundata]|uniref:ACD11 homolog protein n=1 Tax=Dioscorea cayennensis subsp. rotundata TaxID=55577 RepID=A0AB40AJE7_DIOCR|nr:ACD11 homolog protein [Dioscorea cayenensis subsp. rotundata]